MKSLRLSMQSIIPAPREYVPDFSFWTERSEMINTVTTYESIQLLGISKKKSAN